MEWILAASILIVALSWWWCCCRGCRIFRDYFNREELGDDWTARLSSTWEVGMVTDRLSTTDGAALLICDTVHPDGTESAHVSATGQSSGDGDQIRLVVDYLDDDNYHFAEIEVATSPSSGALRLYKRSGGSNSLLKQQSSVNLQTGVDYSLRVCFNASYFIFHVDSLHLYVDGVVSHGGDQVGLATGTLSGTAQVDDFVFQKNGFDTESCPKCDVECMGDCGDDEAPYLFKVVLSGMVDYLSRCGGNCSSADGTYIVSYISNDTGACRWSDPNVSYPCSPITVAALLVIGQPVNPANNAIFFQYDFDARWHAEQLEAYDCATLVDLDLPYSHAPAAGTQNCDGSGATCKVTAL